MGRMLKLPSSRRMEVVIDEEPDHPERAAERLLGAILAQAMHDEMTRVALNVDNTGPAVVMRYGRPGSDGQAQWWEMTPPPAMMYPHLLQIVFIMTTFEPGLPLRGLLRTAGKERKAVRVSIGPGPGLEFAWD